jgi:predicted peptidase
MRISEIIESKISTMSELASFMDDLEDSHPIKLEINEYDIDNHRIYVKFVMHGKEGSFWVEAKNPQEYRNRLWSAAISMNDGKKPESWQKVLDILHSRPLGPKAFKTLTSPKHWKLFEINHPDYEFSKFH